ncbi:MAG: PAS domain S-box protein [Myxococcales bacterium]|nr:PAS domain S-box protein [Myxococcales bacterium]
MLDASYSGIVVVDAAGRIAFVDVNARAILGYGSEPLDGQSLLPLIAPADRDAFKELLTGEDRSDGVREIRVARVGGGQVDLQVTIERLVGAGGGTLGHLLRLVDTQTRARRIDQLQTSEKLAALGELLTGITHELSNRLSPVLAYSELLMQTELDERRAEWVRVLYQSAQGAERIVKSLLGFARSEAVDRRFLNVNTIVEDLVSIFKLRIRSRDIRFAVDLQPQLPMSLVHKGHIEQVLINLINNALQVLGEGGELRIATEADGRHIFIHVGDSGSGVPADLQERIFEPFFTTKAPGEGTGLGLALCRNLIDQHGGRLTLQSRPGDTVFTVELPIEDRRQASRPLLRAERAEPGLRGISCVLLDEDRGSATVLRELLRSQGIGVIEAEGPDDLVEIAEFPGKAPLLFIDIHSIGGDVDAFLARVAERRPELRDRVLLLAGDRVDGEGAEIERRHAHPVLLKPYSLRRLLGTIRHVLRTSGGAAAEGDTAP